MGRFAIFLGEETDAPMRAIYAEDVPWGQTRRV